MTDCPVHMSRGRERVAIKARVCRMGLLTPFIGCVAVRCGLAVGGRGCGCRGGWVFQTQCLGLEPSVSVSVSVWCEAGAILVEASDGVMVKNGHCRLFEVSRWRISQSEWHSDVKVDDL